MAEKLPETNVPEPEYLSVEKKKDGSLTSVEKADESGETGDSSAHHSSDLFSGAEAKSESAMETSEYHGPEPVESQEPVPATKQQKKAKSSKKQVDIAESDSKLESLTRSPDKASRTRSHKKSTSEKETDVSKESDQKTALEGSPPQHLVSAKGAATTPLKTEDATPPKSKSPSILMRLRSHSKLRSERSASLPPEGSTKADEPKGKTNEEKSSEICSPAKRRGPIRKAKSVDKERSKSTSQSEPMDTAEAEPNLEADEKISKAKSKASAEPKLPPTKQEEADSNTPVVDKSKHPILMKLLNREEAVSNSPVADKNPVREEAVSNSPVADKNPVREETVSNSPVGKKNPLLVGLLTTNCEQVSSGIQSIQLSRNTNDVTPLMCLDDESIDSTSSGTSGMEGIESDKGTEVEEIEGDASPSAEDTGTEASVVSGSSAIQEGNKLKKGVSTSTDTLSEVPGLKEEEATEGQELAEKPPIPGQKRVKPAEAPDSDEDEFSAICGSPVKKVAPDWMPTEDSEK